MSSAFDYDLPSLPEAQGAQGSIYFGTRSDGLAVAVKVAGPGKRSTEALHKEIGLLQALEEAGVAGVVRCLDTTVVEGQPAMVMPRYKNHLGDWLHRMLENPTADSLDDILRRCSRLAATLHEVHALQLFGQQLVHRDVKPENIFLDDDDELFLGDFGGAMTIDGLKHVELALFGTPMWAPLDQILPGVTIPDPTWDTYALCVLLYACFTSARPAYQADPRELLTSQGRELWELAREAILAQGKPRRTLRQDFARQRQKSHAEDLVDFTGRAALNAADRAALDAGVLRLATLRGVPPDKVQRLQRALWTLLVRGLSPLSHPSPPNRFRAGNELAQALEDLRELVDRAHSSGTEPGAPLRTAQSLDTDDLMSGPMDGPDVSLEPLGSRELPGASLKTSPLVPLGAAVVLAVLGWVGWTLVTLFVPPSAMITLPAKDDVPAFVMDRTEVPAQAWQRCVDAGNCSTATSTTGAQPAIGMSYEDAVAYCEFRHGRLPTELEWLRAAGSATWPWGEAEPTCAHAIAAGCDTPPMPVGSAPEGATDEGLVDMAGNAWEWVQATDGSTVLMGGSARSPRSQIGRSGRWQVGTSSTPNLAGVRCAYEVE